MAEGESAPRKIGVAELRGILHDADELAKGTQIFDRDEVRGLARHGRKLYGEVRGSGPSPYKVSLTFPEADSGPSARCTCPAAWSRPFCKHAAALLVAWARAPEAFVVAEGPPDGAARRRPAPRQGKVEQADLRKQGAVQVVGLARELGAAGVATLGEERLPQIQQLGENLRSFKLVRLSARTLDLVGLLQRPQGAVPALAYTDLVADLLLTARKLEKHLVGGEPLDPRHVEELVGKTWQKGDLEAVSGLDLVEYAYRSWVTSDQYRIDESRFLDLASGAHYAEKLIHPPVFARSADPKPSRAGAVLAGLRGGKYPGYPPFRLKIGDLGDRRPIDHEAVERLLAGALPDVAAALAALVEHRRDVFAPDVLPVAVRVDTLFARGGRMAAVDAGGSALHLPDAPALLDRLASALRGTELCALLGDLGVDAALPTLTPRAAVLEGALGLSLVLLGEDDGVRPQGPEAGSAAWVRAAREAGAGPLAITLAEVREELASAFVLGLGALGPRITEPLAARLGELGMEKPAALLRAIGAAPPEARLDDFVKLHHVLGMALTRLAGATEVDRAELARVPTYESVFVRRPEVWLGPDEIAARLAAGTIDRFEAAVQHAHCYEHLPPDELCARVDLHWADGSATPYVERALAGRRPDALTAARRALGGEGGRVAKITAIRVLAAAGGLEAEGILHEVAVGERDVGLRALAADARDAMEARARGPAAVARRRAPTLEKVAEAEAVLAAAPTKDLRAAAVARLVELGHLSALPALRRTFLGDASQEVREEAGIALALLGDTEMVDTFVAQLGRRDHDERAAKGAALALGMLGDRRGLRELLAAFAQGFRPPVVAEALRSMGPIALGPLLDLLEQQPKLAERAATRSVLEQLPDRDLAAALTARVRAHTGGARLDEAATLYLKLAAVHPDCRRTVGQAVLAAIPDEASHKALVRAAKKALGGGGVC